MNDPDKEQNKIGSDEHQFATGQSMPNEMTVDGAHSHTQTENREPDELQIEEVPLEDADYKPIYESLAATPQWARGIFPISPKVQVDPDCFLVKVNGAEIHHGSSDDLRVLLAIVLSNGEKITRPTIEKVTGVKRPDHNLDRLPRELAWLIERSNTTGYRLKTEFVTDYCEPSLEAYREVLTRKTGKRPRRPSKKSG